MHTDCFIVSYRNAVYRGKGRYMYVYSTKDNKTVLTRNSRLLYIRFKGFSL